MAKHAAQNGDTGAELSKSAAAAEVAAPDSSAIPTAPNDAQSALPPDAAARDAAKRDELATDEVLHGSDIRFITRNVSDAERAAVVAVLTQVRAEESQQVKRVARRDREPWARSQRVPEGIFDLLAEG
ncbi:hypothetical protein [Leucobacter sp. USHLN153]|uniref:hypothetical protein n=1 Tax=Leucobacter sp. USHLN153 TaxID=3081268 RepID=UPI0030184A67